MRIIGEKTWKAGEIIALRKKLGLTQKEMAQALGCSVGTIEHYCQGTRHPNEEFGERLEKLRLDQAKKEKIDKQQAPK